VDSEVTEDLKEKLTNPTWGVWLGRKGCIPSAPVFSGIYSNLEEVSNDLLGGKAITCFTHQKEVKSFENGTDTLMDIPIDFAIEKRVRNQRRIKIFEAQNK